MPAPVAIDGLVQHIGPALEDLGDLTEVHELIAALLARGDGAAAQRAAYSRRGRIEDVVADAVSATIAS